MAGLPRLEARVVEISPAPSAHERRAILAALERLLAQDHDHATDAWWALLIALALTWVSGLDYARVAPSVLRSRAVA